MRQKTQRQIHKGQWQCRGCNFFNNSGRSSCYACKLQRQHPAASAPPAVAQQQVPLAASAPPAAAHEQGPPSSSNRRRRATSTVTASTRETYSKVLKGKKQKK